jgi:2-phosphosulfolactate phosphatase
MTTGSGRERRFEHRLVRGRDHLPRVPSAGDYVVVDVTHFSTTVAELLGMGAEYVHVPDERGDEFAFRESHPDALVGGGKTDDYEPTEGYDFFNSPSYVQDLPVEGRPTSMTSTNGGTAVARLRRRGGDDVDVLVGGYTNASALGDYLRDRDRPVRLVVSGSDGEATTDDLLGAVVVDRHVAGEPLSPAEEAHFAALLRTAKGPNYGADSETRRRDLELATTFDRRSVVPKLEGERLVDAAGEAPEHDR